MKPYLFDPGERITVEIWPGMLGCFIMGGFSYQGEFLVTKSDEGDEAEFEFVLEPEEIP